MHGPVATEARPWASDGPLPHARGSAAGWGHRREALAARSIRDPPRARCRRPAVALERCWNDARLSFVSTARNDWFTIVGQTGMTARSPYIARGETHGNDDRVQIQDAGRRPADGVSAAGFAEAATHHGARRRDRHMGPGQEEAED